MNIVPVWLSCLLILASACLPTATAETGEEEVCATTQYRCYDSGERMCIPESWKCDGQVDCEKGEDERHCQSTSCKVQCVSTGTCLTEDLLCDGNLDCSDGSDEGPQYCQTKACSNEEFKCEDHGNCINGSLVCDNKPDCLDGSDELSCNVTLVGCGKEQEKCGSGECIYKVYWCDGHNDCADASDETACSTSHCNHDEFRCKNGECVPKQWRCDVHLDCKDNSDEEDCSITLVNEVDTCEKNKVRCKNTNECIHQGWQCDGDNDCSDGYDESEQVCGVRKKCKDDEFRCFNGDCIAQRFNCSGQPECMDGSDELNCGNNKCDPVTEFDCGAELPCIPIELVCDTKDNCGNLADEPREKCGGEGTCALNNGGCDQICIDTPGGHVCACKPGFIMGQNHTCEDIDECEQQGYCSQICENEPGNYTCSCLSGYLLSPEDSHSCVAGTGGAAGIVFSRKRDIRLTMLDSRNKTTVIVNGTRSASGIDYHYEDGMMFWSEQYDKRIYKAKVHDNLQQYKVVVDGEADEGIAVDWIYDNLYYVRRHKDQTKSITVTDFSGRYHVDIVKDNLEEPRSLAVKPERGWLFWSDWGERPRIEMSSMDGTNRKVLVNDNIIWPNGIVVDPVRDYLFWADAKLHKIFSVNVLNKVVKQILFDPVNLYHPYSITVFQDHVYWTDRKENSTNIMRANKFTGVDVQQFSSSYSELVPMNLKIYHSLIQPRGTNQCHKRSMPCSHVCLPSGLSLTSGRHARNLGDAEDVRSVCLCPQGLKLDKDGSTCVSDGSNFTTLAPTTTTPPPLPMPVDDKKNGIDIREDQTLFIVSLVAVTAFISVACTLITFYLCKKYKPVGHDVTLSKCVVNTREGYQPPIRSTMAKFHESESMVPLQRGSPDSEGDPPV